MLEKTTSNAPLDLVDLPTLCYIMDERSYPVSRKGVIMERFKQIISLGYFCAPAMEFQRICRRQASFPFDWLMTPDLRTVIALIENGFTGLLDREQLFQFAKYPQYYKNVALDIDLYHDISPFKPLDAQLDAVTEKYARRIARFYEAIKTPTLFCRYLTESDLPYVLENYDKILQTLQRYGPQNQIVFVINEDLLTEPTDLPIYRVPKDPGDTVARRFLESAPGLEAFILDNVVYAPPLPHASRSHLLKKVEVKVRTALGLVYRHHKQI